MRRSPAAACSRRVNWRSVACSAVSGMLLTRPMRSTASEARPCSSLSDSRGCVGARAGLTIRRCLSNGTVMDCPPGLFRRLEPMAAGGRERLVDVFDNVGAVLDADRQADGFGQDAGHALLLGRHLAMGGRRRMTCERFGIANIDQPGDQLQRIVKRLAGFVAT